ncbi:hypothetical protein BC940DRAFT_298731 [Gongronella butleri]|nr:hypothetical protein BC940DRAFT_298731 [Gongronella butleri]
MNVVAASNLPLHPYESSSSSNRWYKRLLGRYSKKSRLAAPPRGGDTATCKAAATEKCIRRRHSTIQCEDLTAREFAHLTGIDIITTDEVDDQEQLQLMHQNIMTADPRQESQLSFLHGATMRSCRTTMSCKKPSILDHDFWMANNGNMNLSRTNTNEHPSAASHTSTASSSSQQTSLSAISGYVNSASTTLTTFDEPLHSRKKSDSHISCVFGAPTAAPIANPPAKTCTSSATCASRPCSVIQKGRFKIVLGDDTQDASDSASVADGHDAIVSPPCLEWKRKRSQEAASTAPAQ